MLKILFLLWTGCLGVSFDVNTELIEQPSGENSAQVSLWVDGDSLYMSWIESSDKKQGKLLMAACRAGNWGAANLVHQSEALFINWADTPRLASSGNMLAICWPEKCGEGTYSYGLRYATSTDQGASWSHRGWLHEDLGETEHGFVSLAPINTNRMAAVWLDGRAMVGAHTGEGKMQLRYRSFSVQDMGPELLLDEEVCECCGTAMVSDGDQLLASYRNKTPQHIRDIYVIGGTDKGWSTGHSIAADNWEIHGCPVNGPALDRLNETVALTWFTGVKGGEVHLRVSQNGGLRFPFSRKLTDHTLGRVDCKLTAKGEVVASWMEIDSENTFIQLAVFKADANLLTNTWRGRIDRVNSSRASGFPRLAIYQGSVLVAYQNPDHARIKLVKVLLPLPDPEK